MRIARDLHDVVAHNISVINVQANTALHLMDRQPERARSALTTINEVSKQALVELRTVLGVLRAVDESAPRAPAPGLARLGDLADTAAAAGLAVRVEESGQRVPLPADVDLAAYRIVQEALTNSARHSGGSNATVRIAYREDALLIEVDDDGAPRPPGRPPGQTHGAGNGIAGHDRAGGRARRHAAGRPPAGRRLRGPGAAAAAGPRRTGTTGDPGRAGRRPGTGPGRVRRAARRRGRHRRGRRGRRRGAGRAPRRADPRRTCC